MSGGSRSGAIEGRKTISRDVHKKTVRAAECSVCFALSEARMATLAPFLHSGNAGANNQVVLRPPRLDL